MILKGAISPVKTGIEDGILSRIFLVPKKDGGHRPIINLKRLNNFVPHHHFKMEGIHMLKDLLKQGDFMTKIDLKDTYYFCGANKQARQEIPEVQGEKSNISVQLPTF